MESNHGEALNKALSDYSKGIKESISQKGGGFTNQSHGCTAGFAAKHITRVHSINEAAAKGIKIIIVLRDVGTHNDPVANIHVTTPVNNKTPS